jgi:hypothetical protein
VPSIAAELRSATRWRDLPVLLAVPVALLAVAALPTGVRRSLVLDTSDPTLATVYTAHFVHFEPSGLVANLAGFAFVAGTAYALAAVNGRRSRFLAALVGVVVCLPVALSAVTLPFAGVRFSYGFSGVVMGVVALLALELFAYVGETLTTVGESEDAAVVFFAETALIAVVISPRTLGTLAVAVLAALVTGAYLVSLARTASQRDRLFRPRARDPGYVELAAVASVLLVAFPFLAFPSAPTGPGAVVTLTTHLFGFALTFLAVYLAPRVSSVVSPRLPIRT